MNDGVSTTTLTVNAERIVSIDARKMAKAWLSISNSADVAVHNGDTYQQHQLLPVVLGLSKALQLFSESGGDVYVRLH